MNMVARGTTAEQHEHQAQREPDATGKPQLVVVDLGRRQSPKQVKRLRKGRGKLMRHIDEIVEELIQAGTLKANAQPVVIVVREKAPMPWPFPATDDDEEDDDED
jgi:uncharacterized protein DUF6200